MAVLTATFGVGQDIEEQVKSAYDEATKRQPTNSGKVCSEAAREGLTQATTVIDLEAVRKTLDYEAKNICFIGNVSARAVKGTINHFAHCAYGTCTTVSQQDLNSLTNDRNPDYQLMKRILIREAQSACAELSAAALGLPLFGYERFAQELGQKVKVPILRPSTALAAILKEKQYQRVGIIGTRFDLDLEFWKRFGDEQKVEILFPPNMSVIDNLAATLRSWNQAKANDPQNYSEELYCDCSQAVKELRRVSKSHGAILLCNAELSHTVLSRLQCEYPREKFINMLDVLCSLATNFHPPEAKA